MTLIVATLESDILTLITGMRSKTEISDDKFAGGLASAIDKYIKTATVTVAPGIAVTTTGNATTQAGTTTAPGIGTIS